MTRLLDGSVDGVAPAVIFTIGGVAGIGKTALAVHWAHLVADQFPDGQLYINLRGFDPTGTPVKPMEATRYFLDALDVPPGRIPFDSRAQTALYRSVLAGRRMLLVLDNARETDQVRSLLPGDSTCRVLITSRNQLVGLIAQHGAQVITLDALSVDQSTELIARRLSDERVAREPDVVVWLGSYCARLPLALAVVAARAASNPTLPLNTLAQELRHERSRLDALHTGDPVTSVRAAFSWSYRYVTRPAARMFRLLGAHPGPDISLRAAASLSGMPSRQAQVVLDELTCARLVTRGNKDRYTFHDLLRSYARELVRSNRFRAEEDVAQSRVLDHYLHTARNAADRIHPRWNGLPLRRHRRGVVPEEFSDCSAALQWFEANYPVLLATIELGVERDNRGWRLACGLSEFFERTARWQDWEAVMRIALASAVRRADKLGQAYVRQAIGAACRWLGRYDQAQSHHHQALALFEELGDRTGQVHSHVDIAVVFDQQSRHREGVTHARKAVALSGVVGDPLAHGRALNNLGWFQVMLGRPQEAVEHCQQALVLRQTTGDRRGESHVLDSLGFAHHQLGHYQEAVRCYHRSLVLRRELGERYGEALVLAHLGHTQYATGAPSAARTAWHHSLSILDELRDPDAARVRRKIRQLDNGDSQELTIGHPDPDLPRRR